jgi:peptidoglycan/LPS O-acetylase OafA/YrhL
MGMHAKLFRVLPSTGRRIAGIEGLRALAATSVLVNHAWLFSRPDGEPIGYSTMFAAPFESLAFGVTLFFGLSGFLLYRPFVAAAFERRPLSVGAYFRNRALRILPAYWVILILSGLVLDAALIRHGSSLELGRLSDPGNFASAAFFVHDYRPATTLIGIGPAWSLAVEVVFYLALPVLGALAIALARRAANPRRLLIAALVPVGVLLLIGLSGKFAAAQLVPGEEGRAGGWGADWHTVLLRSFWAQADLFAFGMVVAVVHVHTAKGTLRLPHGWRPVAAAIAVLAGGIALARLLDLGGSFGYPLENTVVAASLAVLLALVVLPRDDGEPSRLVRWLEMPVVVAIGLVSYSLFLWHEPVVRWLHEHDLTFAGIGGLALNIAVLAIVAGTLAVLTYRFVEFRALRHKASMRKPDEAPAVDAVKLEPETAT